MFLNYSHGAPIGALPAHAEDPRLDAVTSIACSRGTRFLAAGCVDGGVHVFDMKQQVWRLLDSFKKLDVRLPT